LNYIHPLLYNRNKSSLSPAKQEVVNLLLQASQTNLCVANKAGDRSIIWVDVGTIKSKSGVPRLGSGGISRSEGHDHGLSCGSGVLGSLVSSADVGQLVVDSVGDDSWVESLLLALIDLRIDGLEGTGSSSTAVESKFEFHGWGAEAEVKTGDCRSLETSEVTSYGIRDGSGSGGWGSTHEGRS